MRKLHHIREVLSKLTVMDCGGTVAIATFISALLRSKLFTELVNWLFGFVTEASLWFVWGNISELF
jgi:hypothetical protein